MGKLLGTLSIPDSVPLKKSGGFTGLGSGGRTRRSRLTRWMQAAGLIAMLSCAQHRLPAATNDNNVEWDGLFSDQGPLYMNPTEPAATNPVALTLRVFEGDITTANIKYFDTADHAFHWVALSRVKSDATGRFDFWQGTIPASASLKYYRFQINDGTATAWLNAGGITSTEPSAGDFWIVPDFHTPQWAKEAVYYQIFPDRFNDGDPSNDLAFRSSSPVLPVNGQCPRGSYVYIGRCAFQHNSWDEAPENPGHGDDFFGGDLAGITEKIDSYLKGTLGVTALYLNPIFESPSNHKYDTQDYTAVDPHFGSNAELQNLISTAHTSSNTRISVLLDGVFNHTSTFHQWFDQQHLYKTDGAAESRSSIWSDRYVFLTWPGIYCQWSGFSSLPKLNYGSPNLRDDLYRRANSVMQTYLNPPYGADGWRYDVADNLVTISSEPNAASCGGTDDHAIWQEIRQYVKGVNAEALMLGEEWQNANAWLNGKEWDAVMNYNGFNIPVSKWINCQNVHGEEAGQCLSVSGFDQWLRGTQADYPRPAQLAMMNSLSTHDTARFLWRAGGDEWKMKLAIIFQMTYVGSPAIYYGDEIGLTGNNDPDNRRTFNWDSSTWNQTLLTLYKTLIKVHKQVSAFRDGSFKTLLVDDANQLYSYGRWDASSWAIVVLNNAATGHAASVPAYQLSIPDGTKLTDQLTGAIYMVSNGTIQVPTGALPGHYGMVLTAPVPSSGAIR
jgi:alpha-glucosidase